MYNDLKNPIYVLRYIVVLVILGMILYPRFRDSCSGCETQTISEVDKPVTLNFLAPDKENVTGFKAVISGHIDGGAKIALIEGSGSNPQRVADIGPGSVSVNWEGDWYAGNSVFLFQPVGVRTGQLKVKVGFKTLKNNY